MKINNLNDFITPKQAFSKLPDMPDTPGYDSPITMIASQIETKMEADTMSVIQHYGIDVNKDELIKALNYDRGQYEKGYRDGYNKGMETAQSIIDKFVGYLDEDMIYRIKLAIDKKLNSQ